MKRLGFLGGTFNPIHNGHLRLAEEARLQYDLDCVLFIPNHIPPHRSQESGKLLEGEKRYAMTVLATLANPFFLASTVELHRAEVSYTYDTSVELKKDYPEYELFLIGGADTFIRHTWHRLGDLLKLLTKVLLASRGNEEMEQAAQKLKHGFPQFSSRLGKIEMVPVDISSTDIRGRLRKGQIITNLVPAPVEQYISRYQLYREVRVS